MKKRIVSVWGLLVIVLLTIATSANAVEITPFYSHVNTVSASLKISGGQASCAGKVRAISVSNKCSVTATLKRLEGDTWVTVSSATWSGSGTGSASASGTKNVSSGYSYRVFVTGKVLDSSGKVLETVTAKSKIVSYS